MSIISIQFNSDKYICFIHTIDEKSDEEIVPKTIQKYEVKKDNIDYYFSQLSFINDCLKNMDEENKKIIFINDIYIVNLFNNWIQDFLNNRMLLPYKSTYRPNVELLLEVYKKIKNSTLYYRNNTIEYFSDEHNNEMWNLFIENEKDILFES